MKIPNLLSVQQKYLPPKERASQRFLNILPFLPLILCVVMVFLSLGNPEALFSMVSMVVYMLILSLILVFVVKKAKNMYLKRFTEHLKKLRPYLILGYSEPLGIMFKKDFARMVQMADHGTGFNKDTTLPKSICEPQEQEVIHA